MSGSKTFRDKSMLRRWIVDERPLSWVLIGIALDTTVLACIWLMLNALGPLSHNEEAWLDAIGLVTVPWIVHVFAMPFIFHGISLKQALILLLMTFAYINLIAILIPLLGFVGFLLFAPVAVFTTGGRPPMPNVPPGLIGEIIGDSIFAAVVILVGSGVGAVLHALREVPTMNQDHRSSSVVKFRSDWLGATFASVLAFGGMFIAWHFGLFVRPVNIPSDWMHELAQAPKLPATVVIGVLAFLPHLVMVGTDILNSDRERRGHRLASR
jgi:hypothetical protein